MLARGELILGATDAQRHEDQHLQDAADALGLLLPAEADEEPMFWLWPDHLPAFEAWAMVQTQWRYAGMQGLATGLDYAGVWVAIRARWPGASGRQRLVFADLQLMERAALDAWAEQRAAAGG